METSYTPTKARENFYQLLRQTNTDHVPVMINSTKDGIDGVLLSRQDWEALQETLYIEQTGEGAVVREREKNGGEMINIHDINWDEL